MSNPVRVVGRARRAQPPSASASPFVYLGEKLGSCSAEGPDGDEVSIAVAESLLRAIEGDVVPRLMLAHQPREIREPAPLESAGDIRSDEVERFRAVILRGPTSSAVELVDELFARGLPPEAVFIDLLGSTARHLGELWEQDLCGFSEVTIGLCRLHEVLREHSILHDPSHAARPSSPRILLTTANGDQHAFGLVVVAEFLRREGWRVWTEPGAAFDQIAMLLGKERFDIVGLSAASRSTADEIATEIRALRSASSNPDVRILVGGRLFVETPLLAETVGADGLALDARSASKVARALLGDGRARAG